MGDIPWCLEHEGAVVAAVYPEEVDVNIELLVVCEEAAIGDTDDIVVGVEVGEGRDEEHATLCLPDVCEMSEMMRREGTCLVWVGPIPLKEVDGVVKLGLGMHIR